MITVTLVATLATSAVMHQWKLVEVEAAERHRVQTQWLLRGALDWSRLLLRQDQQASGVVDHLAEPWAIPLEDTKLSMFLAANKGIDDGGATSDMTQAFLSGEMQDLQSKINILNLVHDAQGLHAVHLQRLFRRLGISEAEFQRLHDGLLQSAEAKGADASVLMPQVLEDLRWYGVSDQTLRLIAPYAVVLPAFTQINLNTASALVIWAANEQMEWSKAQALVNARSQKHFSTLRDAQNIIGNPVLLDKYFSVRSQYFRAVGRIRIDDALVGMRADLRRQGSNVRTQYVRSLVGIELLNDSRGH